MIVRNELVSWVVMRRGESRVGFERRESGEVGPARCSSKIYLVKMPGLDFISTP
jgi:hypothetical protein